MSAPHRRRRRGLPRGGPLIAGVLAGAALAAPAGAEVGPGRSLELDQSIELGIVDAKWPLTPRDSRVPAWEDAPDKEWQARRMAVYAAQIDRLDQNVGRIMAALRTAGAGPGRPTSRAPE